MFERVAAFDGDSTMIRVLFADEVFDEDFAPAFLGFAEDFAAAFLVFADGIFDGDSELSAFFFLAGVLVFAAGITVDIADSSGSDSKAAFTLFDNAFFFASSVFGEDAFLTGEILITPNCNF